MATKPLSSSEGRKTSAQDVKDKVKPAAFWIIPVVTALTLASIFCLYYFVYVGAQRRYLANRNFRALALLGEQLQQRISIHTNILEFCSRQSASKKKHASEEAGPE